MFAGAKAVQALFAVFGKSAARGYNAPCFKSAVHNFVGSGLMRRDNEEEKDKVSIALAIQNESQIFLHHLVLLSSIKCGEKLDCMNLQSSSPVEKFTVSSREREKLFRGNSRKENCKRNICKLI